MRSTRVTYAQREEYFPLRACECQKYASFVSKELAFVLLLAQFTFFETGATGTLYFHREINSIYLHVHIVKTVIVPFAFSEMSEERTIKGSVVFQHAIGHVSIDEGPNLHAGNDEIFFRGKANIVECFARTCTAVVEISVQPQAIRPPRTAQLRERPRAKSDDLLATSDAQCFDVALDKELIMASPFVDLRKERQTRPYLTTYYILPEGRCS